MKMIYRILSFVILISTTTLSFSQGNPTARYEIDAKRIGVNPLDKDALPRSREFIRLDSTYYVGYMFEGIYKSDKSSDYLGFKNSIPSLKKAFVLLQKDYGKDLKGIFNSPQNYMQSMNKYVDFLQITNTLKECYDNIEMPDSVIWVLNVFSGYNFPKDHLGSNTTRAWTYHRNRFFTSEKFSFLKNSVEENEKAAFEYCYYALEKIDVNKTKNDMWFGPGQAESDRMGVYHYLALLHCYNKNYDSSEYYYQRLAQNGAVSWNNYGNEKHELGEFAVALEYLNRDKYKYQQKILKEPFYFVPMLNVYSGRTKDAMALCKEAIINSGSTPGFGWYNIALARSYMYDGQLDSAEYTIQKAADFKEIHIGTTLTQSQYDFTINLLKLQLNERKIALVKFENKGWWYSPSALYDIAALKFGKMLLQYVVINQMAANPERNRTVYDLFCGESTTTFDEAFYLIKDFSPSYFVKKYENYQQTDNRKNLQRYFKLFTYQMQWMNGDEDKAFDGYKQMVKEVLLDTAHERLFLGRLYEGLAKGYKDDGNDRDQNFYANALYEEYPQLLPFSGITIPMKLVTSGVIDENTNTAVKELKRCKVNWVNEADGNTPIAQVSFVKKGDQYEATVSVKSGSNLPMVLNERMLFKNAEGVGKELALRLFGKSGAMVFERRDAGN
ncbi:hypothetical protein SAE01_35060 [Segetibacter aerophilus]|uniref:Tetratricopeptide repeat protein n=2 Tax=Segetibacter aerophilus TaxID=670293 RepID=A0A512BGA9_9BACT|nr:hypothetical protein SAE01_35060 [Segetibacter aerophilus]